MAGDAASYVIAIDAGGTMTDAFLMRADGSFVIGKALTNRADEASSYLESIRDAGRFWRLDSPAVHGAASTVVYAGTAMLNAILTGTGRKVGMLVTRGFEHITVMEGGLTWLTLSPNEAMHQQLKEHTRPLVNPRDVLGVSERMCGGSYYGSAHIGTGEELIPLNEAEVEQAAQTLLARGVESIGILFINAFANTAHEDRAAEIVRAVAARQGKAVTVITSTSLGPVRGENARVKSLLFQCFAAEQVREQLLQVEQACQAEGYRSRLLTLLSYGGAANVSYPRLYEAVISGPIGGLLGARQISLLKDLRNVVTADLGGTSFDVGIMMDNIVGIRRTPDFAGHRLALPMVSLDSIGSGAGSIVKLDRYRRVEIGPESAGAQVGVCYQYPELTLTDVAVALGYLNPDNFLGGKVKLDRERAVETLKQRIAEPLGVSVWEAAWGIQRLAHTQTREMLRTMLATKGYDPREFSLLVYGGAGPLHLWGFTEGIPFKNVLTVPWAAAFSAFGGAWSDYSHRYHKALFLHLPRTMKDNDRQGAAMALNRTWAELEDQARAELCAEGVDVSQVSFRYGVYARYIGQLESFDTPMAGARTGGQQDVDRVISAFEDVYTKIYPEGARYAEVGYDVTEVYLIASVPKPNPIVPEYTPGDPRPPAAAHKGRRPVYYQGAWVPFEILDMAHLAAGNVVRGPAIIEDPMTSLVVPPDRRVDFDQHRVIWFR